MTAPIVTFRWSGATIQKGPSSWSSKVIADVSGVSNGDQARQLVEAIYPVNSPFPYNSLLKRSQVGTASRNPVFFEVPVTWSWTPAGAWDDPANPLSNPTRYRWRPGSKTISIDRDISGNPIVNGAGDPPSNSPSVERGTLFLTVIRWEAFYNVQQAVAYQDAINSDSVVIPLAGTVTKGQMLLRTISPMTDITSTQIAVQVAYNFELQATPFDIRILSEGMRAHFANGVQEVYDSQKPTPNRISVPVLLDETGKIIASGYGDQTGKPSTSGSIPAGATAEQQTGAVFLHYQGYNSMSITALGLFS